MSNVTRLKTPAYSEKRIRRTVEQSMLDDPELTWEQVGPDCPATAFVHEDDVTINLQIELISDYALLVSLRKDDDAPPSVTLWHGNGELRNICEWNGERAELEIFRDWAASATGSAEG
jgi:hypothetical protein